MKNLQYLPAIHQLKTHQHFHHIVINEKVSEEVLTEWLNEEIDKLRNQIINREITGDKLTRENLIELTFYNLAEKIHTFKQDNLQNVVNATGVVLHTNLGRARLSNQALDQIKKTASAYSTLEYNLITGQRGSRHDIVEEYIKELTGAEAAIVVNNNAAAVYLVLKAIAQKGEVIVSRGELVEIGGSFRVSEIMEESEANLIAVGTTNKTYVSDYNNAITEETALLMKVHKSNFKLVGFTEDIDTEDLVETSKQHQIPIYEDLGSGTLFDFKKVGIGSEPTVQEKVAAGIDIISFSGDKLLGGPQAGIIVGKKKLIDKMKRHQLARVLRVDKFTLAGLEATLKSYLKGQEQSDIPTIRDILTSSESVLKRANTFIEKIQSTPSNFTFEIESSTSQVGGGTMPDEGLKTHVVHVKHDQYSSVELTEILRSYKVPIIVRVRDEAVILDFRTVDNVELGIIVEAFSSIAEKEV